MILNNRHLSLSLFLLLILAGCRSFSGEPSVTDAELKAQADYHNGEYEKSYEAFLAARKANPTSYIPLRGLALCAASLGKMDLFEFYALEACGAAPKTPKAQGRLGTMYVKAAERYRGTPVGRQYAEMGCLYLSQALAADRDLPQLPFNLGVGFYLMGHMEEALRILNEVYTKDHRRLDAAQIILTIHRQKEDAEAVLRILDPLRTRNQLPEEWQPLHVWALKRQSQK